MPFSRDREVLSLVSDSFIPVETDCAPVEDAVEELTELLVVDSLIEAFDWLVDVLAVDILVEPFDLLVDVLLPDIEVLVDVELEWSLEVLAVDSLVEVFDVLPDVEVDVEPDPEPIIWELWSTVVVAACASVGLAAPVAPIPSNVATVAAPFL